MKIVRKIRQCANLFRRKEKIPVISIVDSRECLKGKTALIVGGSGDIGFSISQKFLDCGSNVIVCGTNEDKLANRMASLHGDAHAKSAIFRIDAIDGFPKKIDELWHIFDSIDILINAAGVHTEDVDFFKMSSSEYDRVMNINLKGAYFLCQAFASCAMKHGQKKSRILLVSSSRGSEPAWSPYGLSKWGLNGLTEGLAMILGPYGFTVNAIAPGSSATSLLNYKNGESISTQDNRAGRYTMPEEISNVALLLCSDAGDMISGEIVHISGGRGVYDIR